MNNNFHNEYDNGLDGKYSLSASKLGSPLSAQVANQLADMAIRLNEGVQNIEMGTISADKFDLIPKEHFKEMKRLSEITGAKISVHAPIVDPAGFTREGWSEEQRLQNERQMKSVIDRSHLLDPKGNIPVTFHSNAGVPGFEWKPGLKAPGMKEEDRDIQQMVAIDQETGRMASLKYEEKKYIGKDKIWLPRERLDNLNQTTWDDEKLQLMTYQKTKEEVQDRLRALESNEEVIKLKVGEEEEIRNPGYKILKDEERARLHQIKQQEKLYKDHIGEYERHLISGLNELHHKFVKYFPEETREDRLKKKAYLDSIKGLSNDYRKQIEIERRVSLEQAKKFEAAKTEEEKNKILINFEQNVANEVEKRLGKRITGYDLLQGLSKLEAPEVWKTTDDFAREKTKKTVAEVAFHAYDKYKDKAPILAIENFYPETVLSRADSLKKLIKESRSELAQKLVREKGLSKDEASDVAAKLIGATWDVGHINMLRKYGYGKKEVVEEAKKIAPYVKHIHLTDNFGFNDTHLPPGMGDVPIKEQLRELEKRGDLKDVRAIAEAGAFVADFKVSPFPQTLANLGSPLYRYETEPAWEKVHSSYATTAGYSGLGQIFPEQHFNMYRAGFSLTTLPPELGGVTGAGDRGRFAEGGKQ